MPTEPGAFAPYKRFALGQNLDAGVIYLPRADKTKGSHGILVFHGMGIEDVEDIIADIEHALTGV